MRLLASLLCALCFLPFRAFADSLDQPANIDIVRIASDTKRVYLYVVLGTTDSLQQATTKAKLRHKLDVYLQYVKTGQVWRDEPTADPNIRPVLAVVVTADLGTESKRQLELLGAEYEGKYTSFQFFRERELEAHLRRRQQ